MKDRQSDKMIDRQSDHIKVMHADNLMEWQSVDRQSDKLIDIQVDNMIDTQIQTILYGQTDQTLQFDGIVAPLDPVVATGAILEALQLPVDDQWHWLVLFVVLLYLVFTVFRMILRVRLIWVAAKRTVVTVFAEFVFRVHFDANFYLKNRFF